MFRKQGVDDLCMCASPDNDVINAELRTRLGRKEIYTNIGQVLISVNPFERLPIYGDDYVKLYSNATSIDTPPHIYHLADSCFRRMTSEGSSQAVIISGESGAGKTECAKLILNYISTVSGSSGNAQHIKQCIADTNPVLESFGNAKTIRNDNSSRFGKYLEIKFNQEGEPNSGATLKFLLEKTRVAFQGKGERNFHIFYNLIAGSSAEMREQFGLTGDPNQFSYLCQSGCTTVEGVDDAKVFHEVTEACSTVGMDTDTQWYIWQLLAGILHLGNVQFQGDPAQVSRESAQSIEWLCHLFQMDGNALKKALVKRTVVTPRETFDSPQNPDQAGGLRDAMAKSLYERIFDFVVNAINNAMKSRGGGGGGGGGGNVGPSPGRGPPGGGQRGPPARGPPAGRGPPGRGPPGRGPGGGGGGGGGMDMRAAEKRAFAGGGGGGSEGRSIGVLDIYGFEIFEQNGFEQFCINYVNERLQQIFIDLTLRSEQQEYHDEGMKWKDIKFFDNKEVVSLIEGSEPPGVFRVLDDVCRTAHAVDSTKADSTFLEKLVKTIPQHQHLRYESGIKFTIMHYAGDVTYTCEDFVFKNKDNLFAGIILALQTSKLPFLVSLFPENVADDKSAPASSGKKIRESAQMLITKLRSCVPYYIRCIKSNDRRAALDYNSSRCLHQVKYLGLSENVKVKKAGFSYRHYYPNFVKRFAPLMDEKQGQPPMDQKGAEMIAARARQLRPEIEETEFGYGHTKMFVRSPETIFIMDEELEKKLYPEVYAEKLKEFKKVEALAKKKRGDTGGLAGCSMM